MRKSFTFPRTYSGIIQSRFFWVGKPDAVKSVGLHNYNSWQLTRLGLSGTCFHCRSAASVYFLIALMSTWWWWVFDADSRRCFCLLVLRMTIKPASLVLFYHESVSVLVIFATTFIYSNVDIDVTQSMENVQRYFSTVYNLQTLIHFTYSTFHYTQFLYIKYRWGMILDTAYFVSFKDSHKP